MPRPAPDAGRRAVEPDSPAGVAYGSISRSLRRRRAELLILLEAGGSNDAIVESYRLAHPLEPEVTSDELDAVMSRARAVDSDTPMRPAKGASRPTVHASKARS